MTRAPQKIQIGLWGYGQHAKRNIAPTIVASHDCHLIGICTTSDDKESEIRAKYNVEIWRNPEAMLADPRIDAVYLATPIGLHYIHAKQVLAANKHLLCEKSLTNDGKKSLDLIDDAEKKGLVIFEAFMYFYHPQFQLLREIVCNDNFGAMTSITCNFCIPSLDVPGFRSSKFLGGSAFWDVGCYAVSLALALVKEFPRVEFCEISPQGADKIDTKGKALITYSSAITAYLHWSYHHAYKNDLTILGEQKSVYVDKVFSKSRDLISTVTLMDKMGGKTDMTVPATDSFMKMFEVFAKAMNDSCLKKQLNDQGRRQATLMSHLLAFALHTV